MGELTAKTVATMTWAFSTAGPGRWDARLFAALSWAAASSMKELNVQGLTNVMWAFAMAKQADQTLFVALVGAAARRVSAFSAQGLANITWALATMGWERADEPHFLEARLATAVEQRKEEFTAKGLASVSWAFAAGACSYGRLFRALASVAANRAAEFNAQDFANLAWACTLVAEQLPDFFVAGASERCSLDSHMQAIGSR
eukprot:gnl/TRDRNA2_/TRDRNA2_171179_c0_seq1.p2 gnl/TRDRNA2_/TRDRNA2_171179_c0~~gnl/TRDRNA2_/TRDRNA2_171179_c0_seq1.p2  ORF type:complete len:202 (-),score=32.66 gnl/TRDRNA2_/TRDRNA2_171179_c0_seq1:34-639(-)